MSDGINFAWYLMFWMTAHFGDERSFWKTATPARCDAMYRSYIKTFFPKHTDQTFSQQSGSLSQYLTGGV